VKFFENALCFWDISKKFVKCKNIVFSVFIIQCHLGHRHKKKNLKIENDFRK
jgi:hypothetical protein